MVPSTASAQEVPNWFIYLGTPPRIEWLKPVKVSTASSELNQLLQKRHNAAVVELEGCYSEYMEGRGTLEFLYDAADHVRKSRLELARAKPERVVIMQDHIKLTKELEKLMKDRNELGRVPTKMYREATYRRIQAEIDLLRLIDAK